MRSRSRLALACALAGFLLAPANGQSQSRFRASAEALQFQVAVENSAGEFVNGLTPEDFRVSVNGAAREIVDVFEIDLGGGREPKVPDRLPAAGWRQFVLLFDAAFNSPRGVRAAQKAALSFIDSGLATTDLVSVVTFDVVSGVKIRVPLTRDRRQVRAAIDGLGLTQATRTVDRPGFLTQFIRGDLAGPARPEQAARTDTPRPEVEAALGDILGAVTRAEQGQYRGWVETYVSQIGVLGRILAMYRGRKHVFFFTTGFEDRLLTGNASESLSSPARFDPANPAAMVADNPEETFGSSDIRSALEDSIQELRSADTLLHMVDVAGVGGGRGADNARFRSDGFESTMSGRSSLTVWADGTGGSVVWNTNRLADALAELERANRQFYVVAISRGTEDGDTIELDIEVALPDAHVTSAPRRFAPPPNYDDMSEAQRQAQLAEFVTKGVEETGMAFDLLAPVFPGRNDIARVPIVVEVPWGQLQAIAKARGDGRIGLDLIAYVVTAEGTMIDLTDRHVELDLRGMRGRMEGLPLRIYDLLWAGPGEHIVRVVVRDTEVGMAATATRPLVVRGAAGNGLTVSTPVVVDTEHPGMVMRTFDPTNPPPHKADGPVSYPFSVAGTELTPMARVELEAGAEWQILVPVAGLSRHPFTGQTQLSTRLSVGAVGDPVSLPELTLLGREPALDGSAEILWIRVEGTGEIPSGFHELRVEVMDAISGTVGASTTGIRIR